MAKDEIIRQLYEMHRDNDLLRFRYGKFIVLAKLGDNEYPKDIRILGPGKIRLSVSGANALAQACMIAEFMDNNPIKD